MLSNTKSFWKEAWGRHFSGYSHTVARQAHYLSFSALDRSIRTILELGAGSFRDTIRLNRWGYNCTGTDFSGEAVQRAREQFPDLADRFHEMDASKLTFPDRSFDLSFHNGLLVVFQDDSLVRQVIQEQVRVTARRVVCTVHNATNKPLVDRFKQLAEQDSLYDIRFFQPDELRSFLEPHCKSVSLFPFGLKWVDRFIARLPWRTGLRALYSVCRRQGIENAERIMAVGELE
jgi:hypothetical protein